MHVVMGEIRKDVYKKDGTGAKGPWFMYAIELSEVVKDRDGEKHYANYRATFFATERQKPYYDQWLQKGKIVAVSCEKLRVEQRDGNDGRVFVSLHMEQPRLDFTQRTEDGGQQQQSGGQQGGWGQPQQPKQQPQQNKPAPSNEPPMDFDQDIPF